MNKLIFFIALLLPLAGLQTQAYAAKTIKANKPVKERMVLMPLRVPEEDKSLQGSMETALVEGLQQKYEVFSGEQVAAKAKAIFLKESRNTAKKECDETRCMQDIAIAFQAELIATANVTKRADGYFLAISIQNIFDNKVVYSKSTPCKNCDAYQVVEKLKELSGTTVQASAPVVETPAAREPPPVKINLSDPETALWEEVKKGNAEEDYQAYLTTYPKGKYIALAKARLNRLRDEARAAVEQQDQQAWNTAQQGSSLDSYASYLSLYPQGQFAALAQGRLDKIKREAATAEATQKREVAAAEAKRKQEQAAAAERQKREAAARPTGFVSQGGLTWMPVKFSTEKWSQANAYCTHTAINGQTGWRLPTEDELNALYYSVAMKGQGWTLDNTWSSTSASNRKYYYVHLPVGDVNSIFDTTAVNVTCVRKSLGL